MLRHNRVLQSLKHDREALLEKIPGVVCDFQLQKKRQNKESLFLPEEIADCGLFFTRVARGSVRTNA